MALPTSGSLHACELNVLLKRHRYHIYLNSKNGPIVVTTARDAVFDKREPFDATEPDLDHEGVRWRPCVGGVTAAGIELSLSPVFASPSKGHLGHAAVPASGEMLHRQFDSDDTTTLMHPTR